MRSRRVIFPTLASALSWRSDLQVMPAIEGGVGAVALGQPSEEPDGRAVFTYPWNDADLHWIEAQTGGVAVVE